LSKVARFFDGRPICVKDQMLLFDFELAFSDAAVAAGVALDMLGKEGAKSFIAAQAQEEIEEAVTREAGGTIDAFAEAEIGLVEEARPIDGCEEVAFAPDLEVERFLLPRSFFLFNKHPLFDAEAGLSVKARGREKRKKKEKKDETKGKGGRGRHDRLTFFEGWSCVRPCGDERMGMYSEVLRDDKPLRLCGVVAKKAEGERGLCFGMAQACFKMRGCGCEKQARREARRRRER
jgi:hypothetical protein